MRKAVVWLFAIAFLLGCVTVWFLVDRTSKYETLPAATLPETSEDKVTEPTDTVVEGSDSLLSLLTYGEPYECTIKYEPADTKAEVPREGTYFTARGMLRGDFLVPELGEGVVSSIILRDETLYTWSVIEGAGYGMKLSMKTNATTSDPGPALDSSRTPVPLDVPVSYRCTRWSPVDGSVFEPPKDIIFREIESVMDTGLEDGTVYKPVSLEGKSPCELCAQVSSAEGQAECRTNFGCE